MIARSILAFPFLAALLAVLIFLAQAYGMRRSEIPTAAEVQAVQSELNLATIRFIAACRRLDSLERRMKEPGK